MDIKNLKKLIVLLVVTTILFCCSLSLYAKSNNTQFVDLVFTINSKDYYSKSIKKTLAVSPFVEDKVVMIPFQTVFEELGYEVTNDTKNQWLIAKQGLNTIKVKAGTNSVLINNKENKLEGKCKVVNKVLAVPINIVTSVAGASVNYNSDTKTISITKTGKYNTGNIMFYEKTKNRVFVYNGSKINIYPLENKEIVNWYSHKGKVLMTMFDTNKNKNNFVIFKNNRFEVLINDFDIKEAFEYNDNLVIHGYDRDQKMNNLYRFDGKNLKKIAYDFYVGQHIIFKDKLVINKYNNARDYSLVIIDKSWTPTTISQGFIIKDTLDCKDMLYMTGVWQSGTDKSLVSYDGNTVLRQSFEIINRNIDIDLNKTVLCNGNLYAVMNSDLKLIQKDNVKNIRFPTSSTNYFIKYTIYAIKECNNKLYLGIDGRKIVDIDDKEISRPSCAEKPDSSINAKCLLEMDNLLKTKEVITKVKVSELRVENNKLIILGTDLATKDPVLYIYNGTNYAKTLDVTKIENIISVEDKIFLDVTDKDRIIDKDRNTMLLYDKSSIKNLVLRMDTKKWGIVYDTLIFAGYDEDIKKNKIYSYRKRFSELLNNFEIKSWYPYGNKLFVGGYNSDNKINSLYRFVNLNKVKLKDNIELINMVKAKGQYYLVYAYDKDSKSPLNGKKILYIYNDSTREFIEMKTDIEIKDMIFIN